MNNKEKQKQYNNKWRKNNPEKVKAYREKNKEKIRAYQKKYREDNKELVCKRNRAWTINNRDRHNFHRKKWALQTDMVYDEFVQMKKNQNNRCLICGNKEQKQSLSIDHCHTTGEIRGLLCNLCNKGLGYFRDSPKLLIKAVGYLSKSQNIDNKDLQDLLVELLNINE